MNSSDELLFITPLLSSSAPSDGCRYKYNSIPRFGLYHYTNICVLRILLHFWNQPEEGSVMTLAGTQETLAIYPNNLKGPSLGTCSK
jgi:hypothetical protein